MDVAQIEQKLHERLNFDEMVTLAMLTANGSIACKHIIDLCTHQNQQIAFRASWTLEYIAVIKLEVFIGCFKYFLQLYPKIINYSVQRSFTKIMMLLTKERLIISEGLKAAEFEECLGATFDWLLNPKLQLSYKAMP